MKRAVWRVGAGCSACAAWGGVEGVALSAAWLFESPGRNAVMGLKAVWWWSCFRPDHSLPPEPIHVFTLKHTVIPVVEMLCGWNGAGVMRPSLVRSKL